MFADGRLGVAVGDVSGKGIPAALLMALALNTFETLVDGFEDQGALLAACNTSLAPRMSLSKQNAAFLSVVVDPTHHEVVVANAGLIAPLLWRAGEVQYVECYGLPLGALVGATYAEERVAIRSGDSLLLVSDGIIEAMNSANELWGFPRLEAIFRQVGAHEPQAIVDAIVAGVRGFIGDVSQHDDMTVVAIRLM